MGKKRRLKVWMLLFAALLGAVFIGAVQGSREGGAIAWAAGLEAGTSQARQNNKMLILSFRTPGCEWCHKLDAETFRDPDVATLSRQFVCVRLDSEIDGAVMQRYGVHDFPTTICVDAQGKELSRISGYVAPQPFTALLNLLLDKARQQR